MNNARPALTRTFEYGPVLALRAYHFVVTRDKTCRPKPLYVEKYILNFQGVAQLPGNRDQPFGTNDRDTSFELKAKWRTVADMMQTNCTSNSADE